MRWIYISPHFDDAVLSCGGLIWEQSTAGIPVEIWTVNAGDPPDGPISDLITRVHAMWKTGTPQETINLRRIEDQNAVHRVGAEFRHLRMVDAIYRRTADGMLMYTQDVFDPIHPDESNIVAEVADQISRELIETDIIVCPLALGGHVDHIITRRAVESIHSLLYHSNSPENRTGPAIWYYADIPYLFKHEDELAPATEGMRAKNIPVSDQGLVAWQEGIVAYESQISSLFSDLQDMRNQINDYCILKNGQTIWERI